MGKIARFVSTRLAVKRAQSLVNNERGATVIEYIGLCAVVVLLIMLIMTAFQGSALGTDIYNGIKNWLDTFFA